MALVSVAPLASKLCPRRSLFTSASEAKGIRRTVPNLGMCRRGKSLTPCISMSLTATVISDCHDGVQRRVASTDSVQRRTGNFHSNLWDDDFIQSLSTPYGAPAYREHADRLIGEVKDMFNFMSVEDGGNDLLQRLLMVDDVKRLGIDRHFKKEIKTALDYVNSYWNEKGIGCGRESVVTDLNSTALGLRTLRLHGYTVSSDVLNVFKDKNGQFSSTANIQIEGEIRGVLNLFRASLVAFPGEKVMDEAETFSTKYLREALQKIPVSSVLSLEIRDVLEYGWHTNLPRLEVRNYMDVFGQHTQDTQSVLNKNAQKLLELAKLEFNIFHSLQERELKHLSRWWKDSGSPEMTFCRHRHVEYYTLASCIAFEPQHSGFRLGFAKMCHLMTVLDDMYDTFGTVDELELFTATMKRWDPSSIDCLPEYMKGVYIAVYDTVNEMAREAEEAQGRDTLTYAREAWEAFIDSYMQEARWIATGYLPSFDEYYENGKVSSAHRPCALQPILTLDIPFPDHILKEVDFPSKLNDLACAILRLRGDTRGYKADRARGEEASSISCYMKDNPGVSEEDALDHINAMISDAIKGLNWELLKPDINVPISAKKHAFDIARAFHYGYKYRDGYSVANIEAKSLVTRTLLESVPLEQQLKSVPYAMSG